MRVSVRLGLCECARARVSVCILHTITKYVLKYINNIKYSIENGIPIPSTAGNSFSAIGKEAHF